MKEQGKVFAEDSTRPTNWWLVRYDDNQEQSVEAPSGIDEALQLFRADNPDAVIRSVSHISYVKSDWIWVNTGEK